MIKGNMRRLYLAQYPEMTLREIEAEIIKFERTVFEKVGMQKGSANEHKYLRGWLLRANYEKQEKERPQ
jgi:hypothetical protein